MDQWFLSSYNFRHTSISYDIKRSDFCMHGVTLYCSHMLYNFWYSGMPVEKSDDPVIRQTLKFIFHLRGLWALGPSNLSILRKIYNSSPSGSLQFNVVFEIVISLFDSKVCIFVVKNIIDKQECAQMCRGVACKLKWQESAISKASLHADRQPMYLKCRVNAQ